MVHSWVVAVLRGRWDGCRASLYYTSLKRSALGKNPGRRDCSP